MFLTDKPWLTTGVIGAKDSRSSTEVLRDQAWSGFKLLLCVLTMLFVILVTAYFGHMDIADWQRLSEPWLLWFNTGLLFLSSIAMSKAQEAIKQDDLRRMKICFITAGLLTFAFLLGQLIVWQHYHALGYFLATNPANTFFYMITAIHGFHLLVGLLVWSHASRQLMRGVSGPQLCLRIDICAAYWHFLLLIWLGLFALLIFT